MRIEDQNEQSYFRTAERVFRINNSWYFAAREGDQGPYADEAQALDEKERFLNEQAALKGFHLDGKLRAPAPQQARVHGTTQKVSKDALSTHAATIDDSNTSASSNVVELRPEKNAGMLAQLKREEAKERAFRLARRLAAQEARRSRQSDSKKIAPKSRPKVKSKAVVAQRRMEPAMVEEILLQAAHTPMLAEPPLLVVTV